MKRITIRTTQNVSIDYPLASLQDRALAFLLDVLIFGVGAVIIWMLFALVFNWADLYDDGFFLIILTVLPSLGFLAYYFFLETLNNGQTIGKKIMQTKVVRVDGKDPDMTDFLLRSAFHLLETISTLGVLSALLISSTSKRQRFGDLTANTTVIKLSPDLRYGLDDILRIRTTETYEPEYTQVVQLREADMITVKDAITRYRSYPNDAHRDAIVSLAKRLGELLDITPLPKDPVAFLKTLLRDYIVLTR